jgi:polysaccharide biosynthesis transport protein
MSPSRTVDFVIFFDMFAECLAIIPMIKLDPKAAPVKEKPRAIGAGSRNIARNGGLIWYAVDSPLSRFAESIRALKMSADLSGLDQSSRVIGITSSLPDEGKTTLAASLALLTASGGARVILVDCDLRKCALSREFAPNATAGLLDVISERVRLDDAIWSDRSTRLAFLPMANPRRPSAFTSEVLAPDAIKGLFCPATRDLRLHNC